MKSGRLSPTAILAQRYQRLRQDSIDEERFDVVSGYELRGRPPSTLFANRQTVDEQFD
jgi:hypothetical protein